MEKIWGAKNTRQMMTWLHALDPSSNLAAVRCREVGGSGWVLGEGHAVRLCLEATSGPQAEGFSVDFATTLQVSKWGEGDLGTKQKVGMSYIWEDDVSEDHLLWVDWSLRPPGRQGFLHAGCTFYFYLLSLEGRYFWWVVPLKQNQTVASMVDICGLRNNIFPK